MEWPTLSLDMNPLENLWGRLARDVYAKICLYATIQDLNVRFQRSVWEFFLSQNFLKLLVLNDY